MFAFVTANPKFIAATEKMEQYKASRRELRPNEELFLEALDLFDEVIEDSQSWKSDDDTDEDWRIDNDDDPTEEDVDPKAPTRCLGDESASGGRASEVWRKGHDHFTVECKDNCSKLEDGENGNDLAARIHGTLLTDSEPSQEGDDFSFPILKLPLELREKIYASHLEMDISDTRCTATHNKKNALAHSLAVYRLEPNKIDARPDINDDAYFNNSSLRKLLTDGLSQSCRQIRHEALAVFYRHATFIVCSIPDLNVFIQAIGPHGQQLLRHIQLCDPLYSLWSEESVTRVLHTIAISCPELKTFRVQLDEEDMLFPALRDDVESMPKHTRGLGRILQNPRITALLQLQPKVKLSFQVDFSSKQRKEYEFLKGDHQLEELPHWMGRFYMDRTLWSEMLAEWQK